MPADGIADPPAVSLVLPSRATRETAPGSAQSDPETDRTESDTDMAEQKQSASPAAATTEKRGVTAGGDLTLAELERRHIAAALDGCGGEVNKAATALGLSVPALRDKLLQHGLAAADEPPRRRQAVSDPGSPGSSDDSSEEAEIAAVRRHPAEVWFGLAHWAAENEVLEGWQRRIAYHIGVRLTQGRRPSVKQARQGTRMLREARDRGFDPGSLPAHSPASDPGDGA